MTDMESGQRGFLITGKDNFLDPYHTGQALWDIKLVDLQLLVSDNPPQVLLLEKIKVLQKNWVKNSAESEISARRNSNMQSVIALVENETAKNIVDAISEEFKSFIRVEENLMKLRARA
jgi:CHASE3 domain sensor protein